MDHAVLVQDSLSKRSSVHKVRLLPTVDVIAVAKRREAILKGRVAPSYSSSQGLCRQSTYRAQCEGERLRQTWFSLPASNDDVPVLGFDLAIMSDRTSP
jgi:hypothetical protein